MFEIRSQNDWNKFEYARIMSENKSEYVLNMSENDWNKFECVLNMSENDWNKSKYVWICSKKSEYAWNVSKFAKLSDCLNLPMSEKSDFVHFFQFRSNWPVPNETKCNQTNSIGHASRNQMGKCISASPQSLIIYINLPIL